MSTDLCDAHTQTLPGVDVPDPACRVRVQADDDWRSVLLRLIATTPGGLTGVARLAEEMGIVGFGRVYISRVLMTERKSRIEKPSKHFVGKVWQIAGRIYCPHLAHDISTKDCATHHTKTYAQVGVVRVLPLTTVDHWRACRKCANNPNAQAEQAAAASNRKGARHA